MDVMGNTLGQFVRQRRESIGLSQRALAKKAKISHSAIYRLEGGEVVSETETIEAIALALGLTLNDLLNAHLGKPVNEQRDPKLSALFNWIEQLPLSKRAVVEQIVEVLLKNEDALK